MSSDTVLEEKTQQIASQKPRRRITEHDLEQLAEHYRDGLNDTEACQLVGIHRDTWYQWKRRERNQPRFEAILSRMRGNRIKWCFGKIEAAANKDFRAARELLALTDRDRFSDRAQPSVINNVAVFQGHDIASVLAKVYAEPLPVKQAIVDVQEVKQLPANIEPK